MTCGKMHRSQPTAACFTQLLSWQTLLVGVYVTDEQEVAFLSSCCHRNEQTALSVGAVTDHVRLTWT